MNVNPAASPKDDIESLHQIRLSSDQRYALEFWWKHGYGFQVPDITVEDNVAEDDVKALLSKGLIKAYRERGHNFIDLTAAGETLAREIAEPKPAKPVGNRVWIELDLPDFELAADERTAIGNSRAAAANRMLKKLGSDCKFWWGEKKSRYNLTVDNAGGFLELSDAGHWFNLDFFAKSAVEQEAA